MQGTTSRWSITYKGIGVGILKLVDGTYQGVTEHGYPFPAVSHRR
jgi:hypothetical protein